jgi:hypothetical protein
MQNVKKQAQLLGNLWTSDQWKYQRGATRDETQTWLLDLEAKILAPKSAVKGVLLAPNLGANMLVCDGFGVTRADGFPTTAKHTTSKSQSLVAA